MKNSKKILAIALSVLMIVSVMPFAAFATDIPQATVTTLPKSQISDVAYYQYGTGATGTTSFDMGYQFVAQDDATSVQSSPCKQWHCDYVLSSTSDINPGDITIGGQFDSYSADTWVTITPDSTIPAGAEIRLLETMFGDEITYATICTDVRVFKCAVKTNNDQINGDDLKVELRLYETVFNPETGRYEEDQTVAPHVLEDVTYEYGTTMPGATVTELTGDDLTITTIGGQTKTLDKGFKFVADDDALSVEQSVYKNWSADYVITADRDVPAGSVTIAGQSDHHSPYWVTVTPNELIPANTETRLLKDVLGEGVFTYKDICTLVNEFNCGAIANDFAAKDIEMNVELRLFETELDPETGKYVEKVGGEVLNVEDIDYTFEEPAVPTAIITPIEGTDLNITTDDGQAKTLDVGYKFTAQDDAISVQDSAYKNWSADYVLVADQAVPAGSITIAGQSDHYSEKYWKALTPDTDIAANTEVRLLKTFLGEDVFTYEDICTLVNEFQCGAIANTLAAKDITLNVELRLFETQLDPETGKYVEVEGGESVDIKDVDYIFTEPKAHKNGSSLTLEDAIALNAYLDIDSYNCAADGYVKLNYNQNADVRRAVDFEDVIVPISEATKYTKAGDPYSGTYKFSFKAAPAQYAENITIELYQSADAEAPIFTAVTNVKTKCEQYIAKGDASAALCRAVADYCRASQIYFGYTATADSYYNSDVTSLDADAMIVPQTSIGFEATGYSFTIVSGLEANIFFEGDLKINSVSIDSTKGAGLIQGYKTAKQGDACINIKGIASGNIDNLITVNTSQGTITLAATNIAKAVVEQSNNIDFVNLARAMYLYSVQASTFFGC